MMHKMNISRTIECLQELFCGFSFRMLEEEWLSAVTRARDEWIEWQSAEMAQPHRCGRGVDVDMNVDMDMDMDVDMDVEVSMNMSMNSDIDIDMDVKCKMFPSITEM